MEKSESIKELATALATAQSEMELAKKNSDNPFFKSHYADLAEVVSVSKGPLSKNGLSITQHPQATETQVGVYTMLMHSSGEWMASKLMLTPTKMDPQGCGSALTYARRYAWSSVIGIAADEDDDGNSASKEPPKGNQPSTTKKTPPVASEGQKEHWREVHSMEFFKKGRMKEYAHPMGEGEPWCTEKTEDLQKPSKPTALCKSLLAQLKWNPADAEALRVELFPNITKEKMTDQNWNWMAVALQRKLNDSKKTPEVDEKIDLQSLEMDAFSLFQEKGGDDFAAEFSKFCSGKPSTDLKVRKDALNRFITVWSQKPDAPIFAEAAA